MFRRFRIAVLAISLAVSEAGCSRPSSDPNQYSSTASGSLPELSFTKGIDPAARIDGRFDNSGFQFAQNYTGRIDQKEGLTGLRAAFENRGNRGIKALSERGAALTPGSRAMIGVLHMYEGNFLEADKVFASLTEFRREIYVELGIDLELLRGLAGLRQAEVENCNDCCNGSTCIFPLAEAARHQFSSGTDAAVRHFEEYLKDNPNDLTARWLLNVSAMALGKYPDGIPEALRLTFPREKSVLPVPRFENIAPASGILKIGPLMAGGSSFEDFNGDYHPDIFFSTYDYQRGALILINQKDGTFTEKKGQPDLDAQICGLNSVHADFNNDSSPDVLIMRGGWERPQRLSLLKNRGDGTFDDITIKAGLGEPIATQAVGWADFDLDGDLDLYVAAEGVETKARLYRNNNDETFTNIADSAGVTNNRSGKGVAWGDYNDDGYPDLYISNLNGKNRLYRNLGNGKFEDQAENLGLTEPLNSFACWFFDYDNDGRLDLFVGAYDADVNQVIQGLTGQKNEGVPPALYRNLGAAGFENVTEKVGLKRTLLPMGCNFGDINGDNFPDIYLGTGRPQYSYLMPNVMLLNENGQKFVDVSADSGTGHLQKGHGVSFADFNFDGRSDILLKSGGATPGDRAHSILFQNMGAAGEKSRNWVGIKLEGVKANRSAIGARLLIRTASAEGKSRTLHRYISTGSSFGANTLLQTIALNENEIIESVTINWPGIKEPQTLKKPPLGKVIKIIEGKPEFQLIDLGKG
jgi:FG-GAP-like repeat/ASPIC and UnbV